MPASVRGLANRRSRIPAIPRDSGFAPGPVRLLPGKGYGYGDNFYEGAGAYRMFMTCNQWTNHTLADAGVRAVVWSPLPYGVMRR